MFKMIITFICSLFISLNLNATENSAKGLNIILTAGDSETQMMAMILANETLKQEKIANIILCGKAGDLADKNIDSQVFKSKNISPKEYLIDLIRFGANVQVCSIYLPNRLKDESILISGISVANPSEEVKLLLNKDFQNLSY